MGPNIFLTTVEKLESDYNTSGSDDSVIDRGGGRIKVRLEGVGDNGKNVDDLPWCFPLLPKHLHIMPKVKENVLVFLMDSDNAQKGRFYIGPITSQPYNLYEAPSTFATTLLDCAVGKKPLPSPKMNADNEGTLPDDGDVAIQGRNNAGLFMKDGEVRLMCGYKVNPIPQYRNSNGVSVQVVGDALKFNREKLGYVQMKYDSYKGSSINIVADKINLLGGRGKSVYDLNDQKRLIEDSVQDEIETRGQRMVYGDELVAFLYMFRAMFRKHVHHFYNDHVVDDAEEDQGFWKKNLNELLCDDIRIV